MLAGVGRSFDRFLEWRRRNGERYGGQFLDDPWGTSLRRSAMSGVAIGIGVAVAGASLINSLISGLVGVAIMLPAYRYLIGPYLARRSGRL